MSAEPAANEPAPVKRVRARGPWLSALGLGLAVLGVAWSRPRAAEAYAPLRFSTDSYALPAPEQLHVFSLGYRAALADLLFGRTLVAAGVHFSEKRIFGALDSYLWAIVSLDSSYRDVYYYADSLLTLSTVVMPPRNYRIARDLQEQGRRLFPDDSELWMSSGEFMAYLAPPHLPPGEDPKEWRVAGARVIEHACDVWPSQNELPTTCLNASTLLTRAGELDASENVLRRLVALSDDPEVRAQALARLENLLGVKQAEELRVRVDALGRLNATDQPLASRVGYQLLGPPFQYPKCAGRLDAQSERDCVSSFRAWSELQLPPGR